MLEVSALKKLAADFYGVIYLGNEKRRLRDQFLDKNY